MPDMAARDLRAPPGPRVLDLPAQVPGLYLDLPLDARLGLPQAIGSREHRVRVAGDQVLVNVLLVVASGTEQVADQIRHAVAADDLGDHAGTRGLAFRCGGAGVPRGRGRSAETDGLSAWPER